MTAGVPESEALKAEIARGLSDLAEGRVKDFAVNRIVVRGRELLTKRKTA
jgi:hypothetical protein